MTAMPAASSTAPRTTLARRERVGAGAAAGTSAARTTASSDATTPDPRVEIGVEEIDEEVDDDVDEGDQEDGALHHCVVVLLRRGDNHGTEPGQREDLLDDDRAADQPAHADAGQRDERERRRGERFP